jgi:hypothetical protein
MKSKRMRWARHVARTDEKKNTYRILVAKPEEKRMEEDLDGTAVLNGL